MSEPAPSLAVVMPAYNAAHLLPRTLPAARAAAADQAEVWVVDPGSTDGTAQVAEQLGARVVRLPERAGPAHARNTGVAAVGAVDVVLFIDSDCEAHDDVVTRVRAAFAADPQLATLTGSYDDDPGGRGFFSDYMNLRHHATHQHAKQVGASFWAGCGAVRKALFERVGGFDAVRYPEPMIEDIELGLRMAEHGTTRLDPDLQVKHLKRWTLDSVIYTDITKRALPWSALMRERGEVPADLNVGWQQRIAAAIAPVALFALVSGPFALWQGLAIGWLSPLPILASVSLNRPLLSAFRQSRGLPFAAGAWLFHQIHLIYSAATFVWVWLKPAKTAPRA